MRPPSNGSPLPGTVGPAPGSIVCGYLPPGNALAAWSGFAPLLQHALIWGDGRETEASLFAKILHGQNLLFGVLEMPTVILATPSGEQPTPRHVGMVVVELSFDGSTLNIVALAFEKGDRGRFPRAIEFLRQLFAPVTWLECYSRREGMERFLIGHGWRPARFNDLSHGGRRLPDGFRRFVLGPPEPGEPTGATIDPRPSANGIGSRMPCGPEPAPIAPEPFRLSPQAEEPS